jgi:hypothetical protein
LKERHPQFPRETIQRVSAALTAKVSVVVTMDNYAAQIDHPIVTAPLRPQLVTLAAQPFNQVSLPGPPHFVGTDPPHPFTPLSPVASTFDQASPVPGYN